ncbi:MAG TPA: hypothetical protein VGO25_08625 [Rhodanobacteraceae bacterium]|nr:hypothetical protein [Rhodanobacteraceae bacterium]
MTTCSKLAVTIAATLLAACATVQQGSVRSSGEGVDSTAAWTSLDQDSDGVLSLDELEQERAMGLLQDFPNADTDRDHRVSKSEWDAWWPRMTNHYVRDGSGEQPAFESAR